MSPRQREETQLVWRGICSVGRSLRTTGERRLLQGRSGAVSADTLPVQSRAGGSLRSRFPQDIRMGLGGGV